MSNLITVQDILEMPTRFHANFGVVEIAADNSDVWVNDQGAALILNIAPTSFRQKVTGQDPDITETKEVNGKRVTSVNALVAHANRSKRRGGAVTYIVRIPDANFVDEFVRFAEMGWELKPRDMKYRAEAAQKLTDAGIEVPEGYAGNADEDES